jgi:hypothetical protein
MKSTTWVLLLFLLGIGAVLVGLLVPHIRVHLQGRSAAYPQRPTVRDGRGHWLWTDTRDTDTIFLIATGQRSGGPRTVLQYGSAEVDFPWLPHVLLIPYQRNTLVVMLPAGKVARFDIESDRLPSWATTLEAESPDGNMAARLRELAAKDNREDVLSFLNGYEEPDDV